jgi:phenylacetate-coenzyme A ligase PaaK-like adenylate-forming protein
MDDLIRQPLAAIERVQNEKLRAMLELCARGHPHYRRTWTEAKIDVGQIQTVADLERLPLTHKSALMADPESFRLNVPGLPLHERALWEIIYTTGSTADPTPVYNTTHDYNAYLFQSQRVAGISDIRETDVIANLFPLTPAPMGAFVRSASNAYAAGATIFAALPGASYGDFDVRRSIDEGVRLIELHRATVLWGVPSFIRRLLLRAIELRADFKTVRMCAITGEASSPAMREDLRRCLRELGSAETTVFDRYGSTELGAFAQCREEGDWHNPTPELQYHEVVDPDSGRRLPDGERGALAVTHLNRRGTILIRFIVGDIVSIDHRPCPACGRTSERIVGPVVRAKDLVKVRGMLINPAVLLSTLQSIPGIDEFQVVVARENQADPLSMDELVVRIAGADRDALAETIISRTRDAVRVRPRIEFVDAKDIYDAARQTKATRFVDTRS